jgi:hypothetical protein
MSEKEGLDIGRVVGLIMENPALIEQIASLAKGQESSATEPVEASEPIQSVKAEEPPQPVSQPIYTQCSDRANRARLLGALKPYLSDERAKAIDSMISIVDVLSMMKTR